MLRDIVTQSRSCRRFNEAVKIPYAALRELIDLARLSPSAGNQQPMKFIPVCDEDGCASVFSCLTWAAYLKDWNGPVEGERPAAYIVVVLDTLIGKKVDCDHGIAAQTIMLAATERGLGGCIMAAIDRPKLRRLFNIPKRYEIRLVLALGKPAERVALEEVRGGNIKYWRDERGVHHVPKRSLDEVILRT